MFLRVIYTEHKDYSLKLLKEYLEFAPLIDTVPVICNKKVGRFFQDSIDYLELLLTVFENNRLFPIFKLLVCIDYRFDQSVLTNIMIYFFQTIESFDEKSSFVKVLTKPKVLLTLDSKSEDTALILENILNFYEDVFDKNIDLIIERLYNVFDYIIEEEILNLDLCLKAIDCLLFLEMNYHEYLEVENYLIQFHNIEYSYQQST